MFWFGKKKNKPEGADGAEGNDNLTVSTDINDIDAEDAASEEEILAALNEEDDTAADNDDYIEMIDINGDGSYDLSDEDGEADSEDGADETPEIQVTKIITDFDELCEYVNNKPAGYLQYMRKENKEVFQLRESHLRLAGVWGSVSMAREYSEKDYARIMLALELLENPDEFYVLPMFTESEMQSAIMTFCAENFSESGKKYVKNTAKFAKFIVDNDCVDEWNKYTDALMHLKLERFCDKNGIILDCTENGDDTDGE